MLDFLNEYLILVVVGVCTCIGYILKNSCPKFPNNLIPAVMGVLGVLLAIWCQRTITPEVILAGLVSGLASTGLHQTLKNFINEK